MAIRPVDLQLAYLAAPQNAAQVNVAQNASLAAQQAAQSAFINELHKREESVEEVQHVEGSVVETNPDGAGNGGGQTPEQRRDGRHLAQGSALGFSQDGEHFIDITV